MKRGVGRGVVVKTQVPITQEILSRVRFPAPLSKLLLLAAVCKNRDSKAACSSCQNKDSLLIPPPLQSSSSPHCCFIPDKPTHSIQTHTQTNIPTAGCLRDRLPPSLYSVCFKGSLCQIETSWFRLCRAVPILGLLSDMNDGIYTAKKITFITRTVYVAVSEY